MTATIHHLPAGPRPVRIVERDEPASVIILPVVRVERSTKQRTGIQRLTDEDRPTGAWLFELSVMAPIDVDREHSCELTGYDVADDAEGADRLRQYAAALESCARVMRANAHKLKPDTDGPLLATVQLFVDGPARLWTSRFLDNLGGMGGEWLRKRLAEVATQYRDREQNSEPPASAGHDQPPGGTP